MFLLGYGILKNNSIFGYAIEGFAILIAIESIWTALNFFIVRRESDDKLERKLKEFREVIKIDIAYFIDKCRDEVADLIVRKIMHIEKIKELGVVDVLPVFDLERAIREVKEGTTLFLQRLYFTPQNFELLSDSIPDLIMNKNCTVQILLSSPWETLILEKRRKSSPAYKKAIHLRLELIRGNIIMQLLGLFDILESLPENKKQNLQVKIHDNFTIGPITGYNDIIVYGHYLNDEIADSSMQEKCRGEGTLSYMRWYGQFSTSWENAQWPDRRDLDDYIAKKSAK